MVAQSFCKAKSNLLGLLWWAREQSCALLFVSSGQSSQGNATECFGGCIIRRNWYYLYGTVLFQAWRPFHGNLPPPQGQRSHTNPRIKSSRPNSAVEKVCRDQAKKALFTLNSMVVPDRVGRHLFVRLDLIEFNSRLIRPLIDEITHSFSLVVLHRMLDRGRRQ